MPSQQIVGVVVSTGCKDVSLTKICVQCDHHHSHHHLHCWRCLSHQQLFTNVLSYLLLTVLWLLTMLVFQLSVGLCLLFGSKRNIKIQKLLYLGCRQLQFDVVGPYVFCIIIATMCQYLRVEMWFAGCLNGLWLRFVW